MIGPQDNTLAESTEKKHIQKTQLSDHTEDKRLESEKSRQSEELNDIQRLNNIIEQSMSELVIKCLRADTLGNEHKKLLKVLKKSESMLISHLGLAKRNPYKEIQNLILDTSNSKTVDLELIRWEMLESLKKFDISGAEIFHLSALASLPHLETLIARDTKIDDLNSLNQLKQLKKLDFSNTQISDLSILADLTQLETLIVCATKITNLEPLRRLKNLKKLDISDTQISDLSTLADLSNLEKFIAHDTKICDLEPLRKLKNLKVFKAERAQIKNVYTLGKIESLEIIDLYGNEECHIITPLNKNKNLRELIIANTAADANDLDLDRLPKLRILIESEGKNLLKGIYPNNNNDAKEHMKMQTPTAFWSASISSTSDHIHIDFSRK